MITRPAERIIALSRGRPTAPALARRLESLCHEAEHVFDLGLARASDDHIRAIAANSGAVIVTKDEDVAVHRILNPGAFGRMVRIGNTRRAELMRRLDVEPPTIVAALERGETLIELA
jgi:predicted nuclease of predicted toxin-antitoxin system